MRRRVPILVAALALALLPTIGLAQQQTGTIFGKVVDNSGAVLPGVTVTISGSPLLQPRILVTSETGTYRAPDLPIGTYSVKFELAGFRTLVRTEILLTIGFNAEVTPRSRCRRSRRRSRCRARARLSTRSRPPPGRRSTSSRCRASRRRATRG